MTPNQVQREATYRLELKRQLKESGVKFNKEWETKVLETLVKQLNTQKTLESKGASVFVTFNIHSPTPGKTHAANKVVNTYKSRINEYQTEEYEDITYWIDGMYYGHECFI
jgi:hypothetical protein